MNKWQHCFGQFVESAHRRATVQGFARVRYAALTRWTCNQMAAEGLGTRF